MRSFGESIYTRKGNAVEAEEGQSNLLKNIVEFSINLDQEQQKVNI